VAATGSGDHLFILGGGGPEADAAKRLAVAVQWTGFRQAVLLSICLKGRVGLHF